MERWSLVCFHLTHIYIFVLTFKVLHEKALAYISQLLHAYYCRSQRSCDQGLLAVHHTRLRAKGDGALTTVATRLGNSRPLSLRSADSGFLLKSSSDVILLNQFFVFMFLTLCCEALCDIYFKRCSENDFFSHSLVKGFRLFCHQKSFSPWLS